MNNVWQIILGVVASVGGIGAVIVLIIKFSVNMIAKALEERYTLKLNKELELYKTNLDNKIYISKTKFDTEFGVYRELSKAFFEMVRDISIMIPSGLAKYPADKDAKKEYENKMYDNAFSSTVAAQDALNGNAPFISESLFDEYVRIVKLCQVQLGIFESRWNVYYLASQEEKESFSIEDYQRTDEINERFKTLNEHIREYLSKLDVLD